MKQLLVKSKKDLSDSKLIEVDKSNLEALMKLQIENATVQIEGLKGQIEDYAEERLQLTEKYDQLNMLHTKDLFEHKMANEALQKEIKELNEGLAALIVEYDNYKVRVQHAFKKQRGTTASNGDEQNEDNNKLLEDCRQLKLTIDQLNEKLNLYR